MILFIFHCGKAGISEDSGKQYYTWHHIGCMDSMLTLNMVDLGFDPGLVNSKTLN